MHPVIPLRRKRVCRATNLSRWAGVAALVLGLGACTKPTPSETAGKHVIRGAVATGDESAVPVTEPTQGQLIAKVTRFCDEGRGADALELLEQSLAARPELDDLRAEGATNLWRAGLREPAAALLDARPTMLDPAPEFPRLSALMHLELAEDGPNLTHTRTKVSASPSKDPEADRAWIAKHYQLADKSSALLLQLLPQDETAITVRAKYLRQRELWPELLELLESRHAVVAQSSVLQVGQIGALLKTGAWAQARAQARVWLTGQPDNVELLSALATAAEAQGDKDEAASARNRRDFHAFLVPGSRLEYTPELAEIAKLLNSHFEGKHNAKGIDRALAQLARKQDDASLELLGAFVWHHSHDEREALASRALDEAGSATNPILVRLVKHAQSVCTIRTATEILAKRQAPEALELLINLLPNDQRFGFPMYIARSLATLGDSRAIPELARFMLTPPLDIDSMEAIGLDFARKQSAMALGVLGGKGAESALREARSVQGLESAAQGALCILELRRLPEPTNGADEQPAECRAFQAGLVPEELSAIGVAGQAVEALRIRPTSATTYWGRRIEALMPEDEENEP